MAKSGKSPWVTLSNAQIMPCIGLGTYLSTENQGELAVKYAIDAGYRHFDTAYLYQNEAQVGRAIKDKIEEGVIKREDVFVTTKLWSTFHEDCKVEHACRMSLKNLGIDYIDLYLMHLPVGIKFDSDDELFPTDASGKIETNDIDYIETWLAMEKLVQKGLVRSIGISNFNIDQMQRVLNVAQIKPVVNQIECSPHNIPTKIIEFCKQHNIILTAYTPLGRPDIITKVPEYMFDKRMEEIGKKYKKSIAQIVLRYLYEQGIYPLPKSATKSRIEENIDIFDFSLSHDDIEYVKTFAQNKRVVDLDFFKGHKYYPFNDDFK